MSDYWKDAAALLRKAAATIEARSALRDGETDLIDEAAEIAGFEPDQILTALTALKLARFVRANDLDSAIDFLAYQARQFSGALDASRTVEVPVYDGIGVPFDDEEPPLRSVMGDKL